MLEDAILVIQCNWRDDFKEKPNINDTLTMTYALTKQTSFYNAEFTFLFRLIRKQELFNLLRNQEILFSAVGLTPDCITTNNSCTLEKHQWNDTLVIGVYDIGVTSFPSMIG